MMTAFVLQSPVGDGKPPTVQGGGRCCNRPQIVAALPPVANDVGPVRLCVSCHIEPSAERLTMCRRCFYGA